MKEYQARMVHGSIPPSEGNLIEAQASLNNDNYRGVNAWNKCSYKLNPKTGKKVAIPNPEEHWVIESCEGLADRNR